MSWLDRMQPSSYAGVKFWTDGTVHTSGRRLQRSDLVGVDGAQYTDFGREAELYEVSAFVWGADYDIIRDDLIKALNAGGVSPLILGTKGSVDARVIDQVTVREERGALAYAVITFRAVHEPKKINLQEGITSTAPLLSTAAADLREKAIIAAQTSTAVTSDIPDTQLDNILGAVNDVTRDLRSANQRVASTLGVVDSITRDIDAFSEQINDLINTPTDCVTSIADLCTSVTDMLNDFYTGSLRNAAAPIALIPVFTKNPFAQARSARTGKEALGALLKSGTAKDPLRTSGATKTPLPPTPDETLTESRRDEAQVAHAYYALTRAVSLAGLADQVASMIFDSVELADDMYAVISSTVDTLLEAPQECVDNDTIQAAEDLRAAAYRHLRAVSRGLQHVREYRPRTTLPVVLIAQELYSDPSRESELTARNRGIHPLFVRPSQTMEVLR